MLLITHDTLAQSLTWKNWKAYDENNQMASQQSLRI